MDQQFKFFFVFSQGFVLGYFFSEIMNKQKKLTQGQIKREKVESFKIKKVSFIVKITDNEMFDIIFPDYENIHKVQPGWTYIPDKYVVKIDLENEIVDFLNNIDEYDFTFEELLSIKNNKDFIVDIDHHLFMNIGNCYIYIEYTMNEKDYINVYTKYDNILSSQFSYMNLHKEVPFALYCENDYTEYVNKFINNDCGITPEKIFLYNDSITNKVNENTLEIINILNEKGNSKRLFYEYSSSIQFN